MEGIIQDNENAFICGFRGQAVLIISLNHSWLPFNASPADFMVRKLLVSEVVVCQAVGMETNAKCSLLIKVLLTLAVKKRRKDKAPGLLFGAFCFIVAF